MDNRFEKLLAYTQASQEKYGASASALIIIQDGQTVTEWYAGHHHFKSGALPVTRDRCLIYIQSGTRFSKKNGCEIFWAGPDRARRSGRQTHSSDNRQNDFSTNYRTSI